MRVAVVSGALVIAAAGCGATPARTEPREQPGAATETVASGEAAPAGEAPRAAVEPERYSMLDGRFSIAGSIALGVSGFDDHPRLEQTYETTIDGCPLVLLVQSVGLVRPEGPVRFANAEPPPAPAADGSPLEIVRTPMRRFERLG